MSENLFQFPSGEMPQEGAGSFADLFTDLGSDPAAEDPFAGLPPMQPDTAPDLPPQPDTVQEASTQGTPAQANAPQSAAMGPEPAQETQAAPAPSAEPPEESNPLLAAMELQESQNARKAAEPLFAQLPVFSYNGSQSPIEDPGMTFEELRIAKADDFPELDDSQSVTWRVTYGKVVKTVDTPRKTKVSTLKGEIESSKAFLDALKKSRDKQPKCLVTPVIKMQKKGVLEDYKGVFPSLDQARHSDKTICFIPARDGRVYERRVNDTGEFITPTGNVTFLEDIRSAFRPALPRIPYALVEQAVSLFRCLMHAGGGPLEALVNIYWDRVEERYLLHVPRQTVGPAEVNAVVEEDALLEGSRYLHYADLHSHNRMPARFSRQDDRDERANRVYLVAGRLDRFYPELSARICNGGHCHPIPPELVLEPMPLAAFPSDWLGRIQRAEDCEETA